MCALKFLAILSNILAYRQIEDRTLSYFCPHFLHLNQRSGLETNTHDNSNTSFILSILWSSNESAKASYFMAQNDGVRKYLTRKQRQNFAGVKCLPYFTSSKPGGDKTLKRCILENIAQNRKKLRDTHFFSLLSRSG